jgi:hypothetical protein
MECVFSNIILAEMLLPTSMAITFGFLNALGLFAEKTFQKGLQSIQIKDGIKLCFFLQKWIILFFA